MRQRVPPPVHEHPRYMVSKADCDALPRERRVFPHRGLGCGIQMEGEISLLLRGIPLPLRGF